MEGAATRSSVCSISFSPYLERLFGLTSNQEMDKLMTTVGEQIQSADGAICRNIESLIDQRALLSQNVLAQLRNVSIHGLAS